MQTPDSTVRRWLRASFDAAVAAADPARVVPPHLPHPPAGRTLVVGGGKAAASMAAAVNAHWPAEAPLSGLVVTRYRHSLPAYGAGAPRIEVIEASHPLPDGRGEVAALRMLAMARTLGTDDLLLALVSGGGSSLLAAPVAGITLQDLRRVTRALLHGGAPIQAINTVRKHLMQVSGGRLAQAAYPAAGCALIISDVVGDDPADIASGPCAPDASTCADALAVLTQYRIDAPPAVMQYLAACVLQPDSDTPRPDAACFLRMHNHVIARADDSLAAACGYFESQGIRAVILDAHATGEAHVLARTHAARIRAQANAKPTAWISGGETTVSLSPGSGRGGRNTEYLLALALALDGFPCWALACDTDGIDGSEDNAGAILSPDTLRRARATGLNAADFLATHNAYTFFMTLGDAIITGATRTNVNDYRVVLTGV